ncbi:hypothetical protein GLOTRDRAFT_132118, partial [Gloeophyllum trabeum ATCC 11539]
SPPNYRVTPSGYNSSIVGIKYSRLHWACVDQTRYLDKADLPTDANTLVDADKLIDLNCAWLADDDLETVIRSIQASHQRGGPPPKRRITKKDKLERREAKEAHLAHGQRDYLINHRKEMAFKKEDNKKNKWVKLKEKKQRKIDNKIYREFELENGMEEGAAQSSK